MDNYFNYFTEIEEHFLQRRGGGLMLSTLDWALIEMWKDAGLPLEAVLRGIDSAFDKYDRRPSKTRKVNSLAYCSQEVLAAAEDMKEAAVGSSQTSAGFTEPRGFESHSIAAFLRRNAELLEKAKAGDGGGSSVARGTVATLLALAQEIEGSAVKLEDIERRLTMLEEKLFAGLLTATPDEEILSVREQADRELAPYRGKMLAAQIDQLHKQFVQRRLMEKYEIPRLSLFYMS